MADRQSTPDSRQHTVKRKATIADVAKAAGVSKTLVSFVLNGRPEVGEETRRRVQQVMDELHFHPSHQARFLSRHRTGVVGLHLEVRAYTDLLVLHFLSSLGERLAEHGYGLLLVGSSQKPPLDTVREVVDQQSVDALVLMDVLRADPRVEWLEEAQFPYVSFSRTDQHEVHCVDVDYDEGARLVVERLWERGHRQVALLGGPAQYQYTYRREQSFRQAAAVRGLQLDPRHYYRGDFSEASGWEAGAQLAALDGRPSALFATTDMMAAGTIRGLGASGVQVPAQVEVIGFGDSPFAAGLRPTLTTVQVPMMEMGYAVADRALARINGESAPTPFVARPHLVVRESG